MRTVVLAAIGLALIACRSGSPSTTAPAPSPAASPVASVAAASPSAIVSAIADHQRSVAAHLDAARAKTSARDGAGCLAELDAYDREAWEPNPSTTPASAMAMSRAMCMMLAGDCAHGKELYRAAMATNAGATLGPDILAKSVDAMAGLYCQGGTLEPRDALLKSLMDLNQGAYMTTSTSAACQADIDTARRLIPLVQPRGPDDAQIAKASAIVRVAGPECLARGGDCDAAWRVFHDAWLAEKPMDESALKTMFASVVKRCAAR